MTKELVLSVQTAPLHETRITKFTNCFLVKNGTLAYEDLWVSSGSGKIIRSQEAFYNSHLVPDIVVDLGGRIISPGLIDVQLNGAFGVNFSDVPQVLSNFTQTLSQVNRSLVQTGVTSYLPTLTSQRSEVYHKLLPFLGPSGHKRIPEDGAESLGAHCEGPFLNPTKRGIHTAEVLIQATGFSDLELCYGKHHLSSSTTDKGIIRRPAIKMITAAPEVGAMSSIIKSIVSRDIIFAIGHTESAYEDASLAVASGASMITHLFNAMRPLHHRNPGVFGMLGNTDNEHPLYFGIIADGIHLHPTTIKIAYSAHPEGCILVTDAMHLAGLKDGIYDWSNGEKIVKTGPRLELYGCQGSIAGSSISLIECVNNFLSWSGATIPQALGCVTATPAAMLGLEGIKGSLCEGADADLVIFDNVDGCLTVDEVWKFGTKSYERVVGH